MYREKSSLGQLAVPLHSIKSQLSRCFLNLAFIYASGSVCNEWAGIIVKNLLNATGSLTRNDASLQAYLWQRPDAFSELLRQNEASLEEDVGKKWRPV